MQPDGVAVYDLPDRRRLPAAVRRMRPLRVMSVCSGISAASVALAGMPFRFVAYSEIDPFCCHVLYERLGVGRPKYMPSPDEPGISDDDRAIRRTAIRNVAKLPTTGVTNFGDFSQVTDEDLRKLGRVDLLEGGTPCQSVSVAGKRRGLEDDRGGLTLEFCRLARRLKEYNGLAYILWENVPGALSQGGGSFFGRFLAEVAGDVDGELVPPGKSWTPSGHVHSDTDETLAWRVLDAEHFAVAQRRPRLYAFGSLGGLCASEVLFERKGEARSHRSRPKARKDLTRGSDRGAGSVYGIVDYETVAEGVMPTLQSRSTVGGRMEAIAYFADRGKSAFNESGNPTLRSKHGDCGGGSELLVVERSPTSDFVVRKLTPVEYERVQGFPDNWTAVQYRGKLVDDLQRYRALGNSMAVPVIEWIAEGLLSAIARQRMADRIKVQRALLAA